LSREFNDTGFFDDKQLRLEIEDFLFGYNVSETEYVDEMIKRKGMRSKLSGIERRKVWDLKEKIEKEMNKRDTVSRAFSRVLLLRQEHQQSFDHIFIDESQDLYPVELQLLKRLSKSSLIMAGDTDQSIYGIGSPFKRANIGSSRSTRILKTNFRNTIPIHTLAEEFRKKSGRDFDAGITPEAFRNGPVPELYTSTETEKLYDQLVEKVKIFLDTIEYDPENLCILAPSAKFLAKIQARLEDEGISSVNIKDADFSFKSEGNIRLSPLHSSKGLDIPVVLLFIPVLFYNRELDSDESETMVRNLIYVSMTRAMENLNVFTKAGTDDPVLGDLVSLMEK
jgi:superfamily I DNA/RNA helicase